MALERLQKILSRAGVASRRAAEGLIRAGRVRVDGRVVSELGVSADPLRAHVEVDGRRVLAQTAVYIVLNKPRAVVSTLRDPEGRRTVAELVRPGPRVVPVGRLDYHTSGALLFTNDGDFLNALAHPRHRVPRIYVLKVKGAVDDGALERWREPIPIEGRRTQPATVRRLRFEGDKTWLEVQLGEGRNQHVRRLAEHAGFPVLRLSRLSFAGIGTEGLRPGQWRPLSTDELVDLKRAYGVPRGSPRSAEPAPGVPKRVERPTARKPSRPKPARPPKAAAGMGSNRARRRAPPRSRPKTSR
jgi:23S rRNA pseudouridine2605 synthase